MKTYAVVANQRGRKAGRIELLHSQSKQTMYTM